MSDGKCTCIKFMTNTREELRSYKLSLKHHIINLNNVIPARSPTSIARPPTVGKQRQSIAIGENRGERFVEL